MQNKISWRVRADILFLNPLHPEAHVHLPYGSNETVDLFRRDLFSTELPQYRHDVKSAPAGAVFLTNSAHFGMNIR